MFFFITSSLLIENIGAQTTTDRSKLTEIKKKINEIQQTLRIDKTKKISTQDELKTIELQISQYHLQLDDKKLKLKNETTIINKLNTKILAKKKIIQEQKEYLAQQIRDSYTLGHQESLKVILNQQTPSDFSRMWNYYNIISKARMDVIGQFKENIANYQQTMQRLEQHQHLLLTLQDTLAHDVHILQEQQKRRQQLLVAINEEINTKNSKLADYSAHQKRLCHVLEALKKNSRIELSFVKPFAKMRHHLPWPLQGELLAHFGSTIDDTSLQYSGILIQAGAHEPVRAIYPGKVIFAQWLRGFGLLVIIDHGNNYLSLYGRNDNIAVQVGDHIKNQEIIAYAGQSGGYTAPALYFSIRQNGKAVDPLQWLSKERA